MEQDCLADLISELGQNSVQSHFGIPDHFSELRVSARNSVPNIDANESMISICTESVLAQSEYDFTCSTPGVTNALTKKFSQPTAGRSNFQQRRMSKLDRIAPPQLMTSRPPLSKSSQSKEKRIMDQLFQSIWQDLIDRQTLLITYQTYFEVNIELEAGRLISRMVDSETEFTGQQQLVIAKLYEEREQSSSNVSDDDFEFQENLVQDTEDQSQIVLRNVLTEILKETLREETKRHVLEAAVKIIQQTTESEVNSLVVDSIMQVAAEDCKDVNDIIIEETTDKLITEMAVQLYLTQCKDIILPPPENSVQLINQTAQFPSESLEQKESDLAEIICQQVIKHLISENRDVQIKQQTDQNQGVVNRKKTAGKYQNRLQVPQQQSVKINLKDDGLQLVPVKQSASDLTQKQKQSKKLTEKQNQEAERLAIKMIDQQTANLLNSCTFSHIADQIQKKMMRRTVRKILFETIQESVDTIYYLEEDTICLANLVLDSVIREQISLFAAKEIKLENQAEMMLQVTMLNFVNEIASEQLAAIQHNNYNGPHTPQTQGRMQSQIEDNGEVLSDEDEQIMLNQVKQSLASHTFRNIEFNYLAHTPGSMKTQLNMKFSQIK